MRSHAYQFTAREVMALVSRPVLLVVALALAIHGAASVGLLPRPKAALDVDRTILVHQAEAARRPSAAKTVFIGDSSCLMNVAADEMGADVLNLGTLSYLDLASYARLLREYLDRNGGSVQRVVLLMHPAALRLGERNEYFREVIDAHWEGRDLRHPGESLLPRWFGASRMRARVLNRVLPEPLPGAYGRFYGFSDNLWRYLDAHQGSMIDPRAFDLATAQGTTDFRLAPRFEAESRVFRQAVPAGVRLEVGLTPVPEGLAMPGEAERHLEQLGPMWLLQRRPTDRVASLTAARLQEILREWSQWLEADRVLTNLPPTMPDRFFASPTHLNADGRKEYLVPLRAVLSE